MATRTEVLEVGSSFASLVIYFANLGLISSQFKDHEAGRLYHTLTHSINQ